ncbi:MAG: hypothetical protein WA896_05690, partial [Spirulinaceae cyanobacterium]
MSYFTDLTIYSYSRCVPEEAVLNVGWLGDGHTFPTGNVSDEFVTVLKALCLRPVMLHRGLH